MNEVHVKKILSKTVLKLFQFNLFIQQVHGQLKADRSHVCLLQGGRDVQVDVKKPLHHSAFLSLDADELKIQLI